MAGFQDKQAARDHVWDALENEGEARFPFPPHGRIPNFAGAPEAARRLVDHPLLADAETVKVNPDAPQRFVRQALLEAGVEVYVPTPRLRGGFHRLDPAAIDEVDHEDAAKLSRMDDHSQPASLEEMPEMDAIVAGSVAVTDEGHRAGKGEGYSDLEYAILRELGHPPAPVATSVHPLQVVDEVPREPTDVPLSLIVTPDRVLEVDDPPPPPEGVDWSKLDEERVEGMPVLAELRGRG
jgi:5-formyltetrahydrofolate cyclo-ligase